MRIRIHAAREQRLRLFDLAPSRAIPKQLQIIHRICQWGRGLRSAAELLLGLLNHCDDLGVSVLSRQCPGRSRIAMGINTRPRIGSVPHQQTNHIGRPVQNREMDRTPLVGVSQSRIRQTRLSLQNPFNLLQVVGSNRVDKI